MKTANSAIDFWPIDMQFRNRLTQPSRSTGWPAEISPTTPRCGYQRRAASLAISFLKAHKSSQSRAGPGARVVSPIQMHWLKRFSHSSNLTQSQYGGITNSKDRLFNLNL